MSNVKIICPMNNLYKCFAKSQRGYCSILKSTDGYGSEDGKKPCPFYKTVGEYKRGLARSGGDQNAG